MRFLRCGTGVSSAHEMAVFRAVTPARPDFSSERRVKPDMRWFPFQKQSGFYKRRSPAQSRVTEQLRAFLCPGGALWLPREMFPGWAITLDFSLPGGRDCARRDRRPPE